MIGYNCEDCKKYCLIPMDLETAESMFGWDVKLYCEKCGPAFGNAKLEDQKDTDRKGRK